MKILSLVIALSLLPITAALAQTPAPGDNSTAPKATLLHFWATWCGPCMMELPSIDRLTRDLAAKHIAVIAMSEDQGGPAAVSEFFNNHPEMAHIKTLYDVDQSSGKKLHVDGIPTTIVIGANGQELTRFTGAHDWDSPEMRKELDAAIAGQ